MKEDNLKIGQLITTPQERDACHIALAPVVSSQVLLPGDHVGILKDGRAGENDKPIGIVDPFLTTGVKEDEKFWLFLYPGSITALKHEWTHPAFDKVKVKLSASEEWMRKTAGRVGFSYEELMAQVKEAIAEGSAWGGDDTSSEWLNDNRYDLFAHYAKITDTEYSEAAAEDAYFSCAC